MKEQFPLLAAVICAAGLSSRMGGIKKEYQKLNDSNVTVLGAAVCAFCAVSLVEIILIAVQKGTEETARAALPPDCLTAAKPKIIFANGGKTRRATVLNALLYLKKYDPHYVLIHDGARPWVSPSLIKDVIDTAAKYGAVVPALSLRDTPKECNAALFDSEGRPAAGTPVFVTNHLKRANTVIAQTPQGFKFPEILNAHEQAAEIEDEEFTDDAEIWGRFCGSVAVIPGLPENRKITFPQDMARTGK